MENYNNKPKKKKKKSHHTHLLKYLQNMTYNQKIYIYQAQNMCDGTNMK